MSLALPSQSNNNPFSTPGVSPTSSNDGHRDVSPSSSSEAGPSSFVPPPLPPRPIPAGKRKPVPSYPNNGSLEGPVPRAAAPALPPRPERYSITPDQPTYQDHNIVDRSQLPPPPPPINEKYGPYPARKKEKWWYPASTKGRRWWWGCLVALILAIAIAIAVCAAVLSKKHSSSEDEDQNTSGLTGSTGSSGTTSGSTTDGGHPLSVANGGVNIGKPGDIASFGKKSTDHFVMTTNRSIAVTRLDPIVNPNAPASHLHRIHGSSYFTANLTSASEMQKLAQCTTTSVQDDKSAYWVAQLYYQWPNGSLSSIPLDRTSLYYFQKAPTGVPIYPFPDNYNIVAGDPMRRSVNESDPSSQALWWQCYRGNKGDTKNLGFPSTDCGGGLVQAIQFPSCWDGVYADDADYSTHVAYPEDGTNGYRCPAAFPKKFITLQFETVFATYKLPFNGAGKVTWVMSNGDTSGYGIHADFMNGWKAETLQGVLDDCRYMNATALISAPDDPGNCPHLNKTMDFDITYGCRLQTPIVDEDVGELNPIKYLPGCNGIWSGNTSKPACPPDHVEGGYLEMIEPTIWINEEPYRY
ncbi:hypothetical protein I302_101651 [Kwoniella bestiolae CBS 10118]|uniref:DUF1996 domain-containing protein n=1 Tax=Kwoniella bestiolae CBS 10118 TaxID=1296100 RepID=A0A1B9GCU4_9TREE|nr:hypothetical protein I302_00330 [Kwoniella bestiolae CBS 10118]OCF28840.1 hypothetical protein I302_00330 [Kwoniella bestiolae CBS 10118]